MDTTLYIQAVDAILNSTAQSKGYDNIVSACSYSAAQNPFQIESTRFVVWRGEVWAACYVILADVQAGVRGIPTIDELLSELPQF